MSSLKKIVLSLALAFTGVIAYVAVAAGPEYYFIRCDNGELCYTTIPIRGQLDVEHRL